jgi:hypothetical protein
LRTGLLGGVLATFRAAYPILRSPGKETYSIADENGINKKRLRWLISIVNLGKLFRVFLRWFNVAKHDAIT